MDWLSLMVRAPCDAQNRGLDRGWRSSCLFHNDLWIKGVQHDTAALSKELLNAATTPVLRFTEAVPRAKEAPCSAPSDHCTQSRAHFPTARQRDLGAKPQQ